MGLYVGSDRSRPRGQVLQSAEDVRHTGSTINLAYLIDRLQTSHHSSDSGSISSHFGRPWQRLPLLRYHLRPGFQRLPRHWFSLIMTFTPRNILLDCHNQIWLIDWEFAGFHPKYFEYASMYQFHKPQSWNWFAWQRWRVFSWISAGYYEKEKDVLRGIQSKFTRWRVGRRFELMQNGGPCKLKPSPD